MKLINIAGQRFGRLVVLRRVANPRRSSSDSMWLCRCDCGKEVEKHSGHLRHGRTISCGCFHRQELTARNTRHGNARRNKKAPEYGVWLGAKQRCENPRETGYRNYGGRGIRMCDRWRHSFEAFLADMGPRPSPKHSIDRIDVNGNYEPTNCRWATRATQSRNRRDAIMLTFAGETMHVQDWAARIGCTAGAITNRVAKGWPVERALTEPFREWPSRPETHRRRA